MAKNGGGHTVCNGQGEKPNGVMYVKRKKYCTKRVKITNLVKGISMKVALQ